MHVIEGPTAKNWGGLGTLVKEEIETAHTVHKGLAKLLYRLSLKSRKIVKKH
jgi:hypothetical protein